MTSILTSIFFILAALSFGVLSVFVFAEIFNEVEFNTVVISFIIFFTFCVLGCVSAVIDNYKQEKPKIKEYPLKEWEMEYKITTMNEKSDTILVLTKIK